MDKEIYWIWFNKTKRLSIESKFAAIENQTPLEDIFLELWDKVELKLLNCAEQIYVKHEKLGIKMITPDSELYRDGMPLVVYYLGTPCIGKQIAVVGTRDCSAHGYYYTKVVAKYFVERDYTINSGLAYGIDSLAHRETIRLNGSTQAFVAHGLDICYPAKNKWLMNTIAKNGCVYSQYEAGVTVQKFRFLERNALMSRMSDEICVVEASLKSGALNTGKTGIKQSRPVWTINGPEDSAKCAGNRLLLQNGAMAFDAKINQPEGQLHKLLLLLKQQPMTIDEINDQHQDNIEEINKALLNLEYQLWVSLKADGKWHYNGW